jgi:orsellinic acid C2-O-methyltransferase
MSQSTASEIAGSLSAPLMLLINGFMGSQVVHVAAELGVADLLADGAQTAEALAQQSGTHAPSLHRLLRALASLGLLDEVEPGRFALTALGAQLRTAVPGSLRNRALLFGGERHWRSWGELLRSVRTGETAMQHLYGMGGFEYLAAHPQQAAIFNEAMAETTRQVARAVVTAYDFSRFRTIVDIGGGNGALIAVILAAAPELRGIVFDLPSGNVEASRQLAAADVAERYDVIAGDFFRSVPSSADAYILKSIIHDWDDERSVAILKNCRKVIPAYGKLLLVERVMPARMEASQSRQQMSMTDIHMLVLAGGRERTETEFQALFAAADFELARILPLPEAVGFSVIEAVPA